MIILVLVLWVMMFGILRLSVRVKLILLCLVLICIKIELFWVMCGVMFSLMLVLMNWVVGLFVVIIVIGTRSFVRILVFLLFSVII